jgi:hypothetical protein
MNDPRITAYALNELHGAEREKFETDLARDTGIQSGLQEESEVVGALGQVMTEPAEGLEAGARADLLRAMAANQEAFRARRKMVRFAVPVSLAAAASIAVLLWVAGGTTPQRPAVAAADGAEVAEDSFAPQAAKVNRGLSAGFRAKIKSNKATFTFRGDGQLSASDDSSHTVNETRFRVNGIRTYYTAGRTISMSESARVAQELREDAGLSLTSPAVRMKPLIWDDDLSRWGSAGGQP